MRISLNSPQSYSDDSRAVFEKNDPVTDYGFSDITKNP